MILLELQGLAPLPTHCEAGVSVVHAHIYPLLNLRRVAICCSFDEETAVSRAHGPGLKGIVTDLETAQTFEIRGLPDFKTHQWSDLWARPVDFDSRTIQ